MKAAIHKLTTTLYRPVGPEELSLIEYSDWRRFPPRLPEQPIFYPVLNKEYAIQIARDWNVGASGSGFVTRFSVFTDYLNKFGIQNVGGKIHDELWVPAEELEEFNDNIFGPIIVIESFYAKLRPFSKFDTILAVRGDGDVIHKGFLLQAHKSIKDRPLNTFDSYKTIYMIKSGEKNIKKFYGKQKYIKIYSTRLVLIEKININKEAEKLDFWENTF